MVDKLYDSKEALDCAYSHLSKRINQFRINWEILGNYCSDQGLKSWFASKAYIEVRFIELEINFLSHIKSNNLYWQLNYELKGLTTEFLNIIDANAFFDLKFEEFEAVEISEEEEK